MPAIYYHTSTYISHRIAGQALAGALRTAGVRVVDRPEDADAVIVHDEPRFCRPWAERFAGRKILIAYCVWEADILPDQFRADLDGFDRIWTCSSFSAEAFRQRFDHVDVVPHVVDLRPPSDRAVDGIKRAIRFDESLYYFYTVVDSVNPRKNFRQLLEVFAEAFGRDPGVRLVAKQYRTPWDLAGLPNVLDLRGDLSDDEMSALHMVCDCCLSAHKSEAWGLSLSDAMAAGNVAVSTGYSGNMEYMNESNSLPVRYSLSPVSREMCEASPLFTREMSWADIDPNHMAYLMRRAARGVATDEISRRARLDMQSYGPLSVGELMKDLLSRL